MDTKGGGGPGASCLWMQKIPIFIFEYFPKIDAFDTFPLFVCFFHLNISSCVNSSAPLCLCHVCYSCVLLHLSLPYHRPGCTTVCVTWPILPVLTFLQVASERRMMGVPGRITWGRWRGTASAHFSQGSEPPGCGSEAKYWDLGKYLANLRCLLL